jgi:hypothetical protein
LEEKKKTLRREINQQQQDLNNELTKAEKDMPKYDEKFIKGL